MFYGSFSLEQNTELQKNNNKTYKTSTYICVHKVIVFNFVKVLIFFFKCNRIMFKCQIIAVLLRIMSNIESKFGNKDWKKNCYVNLCLVTVTTLDIFDNNNNISTQKLCLQIFTYTHSKTYPTLIVVPFNHPFLDYNNKDAFKIAKIVPFVTSIVNLISFNFIMYFLRLQFIWK